MSLSITGIPKKNNYYPFGLQHKGYNTATLKENNFFNYNGKELNEALGLNVLEMDLRQYDPSIARWTSNDPVVHHSFSPYNAFDNNPVYWADPSGADSIYNWDTGQYVINGREVTQDEAIAYAQSGGNADGSNNNTPDDIIFTNNNGQEIGRIVIPGMAGHAYIPIDTDSNYSFGRVNPESKNSDGKLFDAIGVKVYGSIYVGGGMESGVELVLFLSGVDKYKLYALSTKAGGVGYGGAIGADAFGAIFTGFNTNTQFSAIGYEGKFSSFGFSVFGFLDVGFSWSNNEGVSALWPGQRGGKTTWVTESLGGSKDIGTKDLLKLKFNANLIWGEAKLMNGGKPILNVNDYMK